LEQENEQRHHWNRVQQEIREELPHSQIVEDVEPPKPVIQTQSKAELEKQTQFENFVLLCLIGVFGVSLMIALVCSLGFCYKQWVRKRE